MQRTVIAVAALTLALAACSDSPTGVNTEVVGPISADQANSPTIAGRFIITLRARSDPARVASDHRIQPDYMYHYALNGFAGAISDAARQGLLRDNRVVRVEPDGIATIVDTRSGATWGLDRVDQRALPLSGTYSYTSTGSGVTAYIIDTGLRFTHSEFHTDGLDPTSRAFSGYDAVDGGAADDGNGHGTHVAGTVGGLTYGVAQGVRLVGVRVLGCAGTGTLSGVIAGVDWVTGNAMKPAVANMSLGGGSNSSLDDAVRNMIAAGVVTAVSAGNGTASGRAQNACQRSPARVPEAMTIGATDKADQKASWSNYGNCVDWFAPGVEITSAWHSSDLATNTIGGTSMAAPHTAGVAALYLETNPTATAQQVRDALFANTSKGIVINSRTANNHLLFTDY
jgi:subtilisin family serine protease